MLIFNITIYLFAVLFTGFLICVVFGTFWQRHKQKKIIKNLVEKIQKFPEKPKDYSAGEIFAAVKLINRIGKLPNSQLNENDILRQFWYQKAAIIYQLSMLVDKFNLDIKLKDFSNE